MRDHGSGRLQRSKVRPASADLCSEPVYLPVALFNMRSDAEHGVSGLPPSSHVWDSGRDGAI